MPETTPKAFCALPTLRRFLHELSEQETRVLIRALPPADCVTLHNYCAFLIFGIKEGGRGQPRLNFSVLFPGQRRSQESVYAGLGDSALRIQRMSRQRVDFLVWEQKERLGRAAGCSPMLW